MSRLEDIKEYIDREYKNLCKSINRARTQTGVNTKRRLLEEHLEEFESILKKYEDKIPIRDWNKLTDDFEFVKTKVELSLKILNRTVLIPEKERKQRRNSEYCLEIVIPAYEQNDISVLEISQAWEDLPFTSSFKQVEKEKSGSYIENKFLDHIKDLEEEFVENNISINQISLKQIEDLDIDETSFCVVIEKLKDRFSRDSFYFNRTLKPKFMMADPAPYEFPMVMAMQSIPEFHGKHEQLRPFLILIDYFAEKIPEKEDQTPLLNVVYTKLRGEALTRLTEIEDDNWEKVKTNLESAFNGESTIGSLIKQIETLVQGDTESFEKYRSRAAKLYHQTTQLKNHDNDDECFVGASLRRHFLAGLNSRALAFAGKSQREKSFLDLLEWLQKEYDDEEELKDFHNRLHPTRMVGSTRQNPNNNHSRGNNNQHQNYNNNIRGTNNNYSRGNNNQQYNYNNNFRGSNNHYRGNNNNSWNSRNLNQQNFRDNGFQNGYTNNRYQSNGSYNRSNFNQPSQPHNYQAFNQNRVYTENRGGTYYPNNNYDRNQNQFPRQDTTDRGYNEGRNYNQQKN